MAALLGLCRHRRWQFQGQPFHLPAAAGSLAAQAFMNPCSTEGSPTRAGSRSADKLQQYDTPGSLPVASSPGPAASAVTASGECSATSRSQPVRMSPPPAPRRQGTLPPAPKVPPKLLAALRVHGGDAGSPALQQQRQQGQEHGQRHPAIQQALDWLASAPQHGRPGE
jgi:hypothetical protein